MRRLCRGFKPQVPTLLFFFSSSLLFCFALIPFRQSTRHKDHRPSRNRQPVQQMANGAAFEGIVRSFASPAASTLDLAALKKGGHKRAQVKRKRRNSRQQRRVRRVRTHEEVATRATSTGEGRGDNWRIKSGGSGLDRAPKAASIESRCVREESVEEEEEEERGGDGEGPEEGEGRRR